MKHRIEDRLDQVLSRAAASPAPRLLAEALSYSVKPGGARIRPTILLSVAMACKDPDPKAADAAAAALELIHCASLVHDDLPCFDNSDLRRGKPTVHKAFNEPIAVLSGDTLIIEAFTTLARLKDTTKATQLIQTLGRYTGSPFGICAGQAWESETQVDLKAYHMAKTGALFIAATQMGAIAADQDPEQWYDLGALIGEAFQVADDLRDALFDESIIGKPGGQDEILMRPNAVSEYGVDGALARLKDILAGAIASIPACPGEAALAQMVRHTAEKLTPSLDQATRVPGE